jgi:plastocyanin
MHFPKITALLTFLAIGAAVAVPTADNTIETRNKWAGATITPAVHHVQVGGANIFQYTPAFVFAIPGDTIRFDFRQLNHTITQSSFTEPCKAHANGFDSGFKPNRNGDPGITVDYVVPKHDGPIWFYCKQGKHCSVNGMVFAINPTVEKDFTAFFNNAKKSVQ